MHSLFFLVTLLRGNEMKKELRRARGVCCYFVNGTKTLSGLRGLWGDVSGLWGDVDDCGITKEERDEGVEVKDLIGEKE